MNDSSQFKKLKLVEEQELMRLIAKQLRDYDPALRSLASMKMEMDSALDRSDLRPEEKIALIKGVQQRFSQIKSGATVTDATSLTSPLPAPLPVSPPPPPAPVLASAVGEEPSSSRAVTPTPQQKAGQDDYFSSPGETGPPLESTAASAITKLPAEFLPQVLPNHVKQLNALSSLIQASPEILSAHPQSGELVIDGARMPNSSFKDLMKSLYESDSKNNLTGQEQFLSRVGKILGAAGSDVKIRNFVPRTSLHPSIKMGYTLGNMPPALSRSPSPPRAGQKGNGKAHPPGKRIQALYLYS